MNEERVIYLAVCNERGSELLKVTGKRTDKMVIANKVERLYGKGLLFTMKRYEVGYRHAPFSDVRDAIRHCITHLRQLAEKTQAQLDTINSGVSDLSRLLDL